MIIDTNFVIDVLNGREFAISKLKSMTDRGVNHAITTPTIFELWGGITAMKKSEDDKKRMVALLQEQIIYPFDKESAETAGKIHGELVTKGLMIEPVDSMIAGIAKIRNRRVLTRDEHFRRIAGLEVEHY
ncbi:PIN domain-containing protein [Candidatus Woesearchaeota archaeon]|nr:PIN domain-containing protein [Candidatus Woesearchaeota archaeon]MBI2661520.1 PIN domain-containing protein [Candidatus Woesearchaeota archaeon]